MCVFCMCVCGHGCECCVCGGERTTSGLGSSLPAGGFRRLSPGVGLESRHLCGLSPPTDPVLFGFETVSHCLDTFRYFRNKQTESQTPLFTPSGLPYFPRLSHPCFSRLGDCFQEDSEPGGKAEQMLPDPSWATHITRKSHIIKWRYVRAQIQAKEKRAGSCCLMGTGAPSWAMVPASGPLETLTLL